MGFLTKITDAIGLTDTGAGDRALSAQADAMKEANKYLQTVYDESKERYQPWMEGGANSFNDMIDMANNYQEFSMDNWKEDPGYQFRLSEGNKAIERAAAARGGQNSGATMKALANYNQNAASDEYSKVYNRSYNQYNNERANKFNTLNTIANYGMNANNALAGQGQSYAQNMANNTMGYGNSAAAVELNRGNEMKDLMKMGMQAGAMFCWVARAVFGEDDPKWRQARHFIRDLGPKWFKKLYGKYGPNFAKKVEKSKFLRIVLRPLFEYFAWKGRCDLVSTNRTLAEVAC